MQLHLLDAEELRQALPMPAAIEAMADAYRQLSAGGVHAPLRSRLPQPQAGGVSLVMPAAVAASGETAVKIVSVFPDNPDLGLPTIHALVIALSAESGAPLAIVEGGALTAIRTGAGSGAATRALARPEAASVAIIGAGVQARTQLEAVCCVREIHKVYVYSRTAAHAREFAQSVSGVGPVPDRVEVSDTAEAAVSQSDIICTATTSSTPVFDGNAVQPGAHINAVGSFAPEMEELDDRLLQRARIFVDSMPAALEEAGELIGALRRDSLQPSDILGEIGQVLSQSLPGRTDASDITLFKSVGVAVQDAVAADRALTRAQAEGIGRQIELRT